MAFGLGLGLCSALAFAVGSPSQAQVPQPPAAPQVAAVKINPKQAGVRPATKRRLTIRIRNSGNAPARNLVVRIRSRGAAYHRKQILIRRIPPRTTITRSLSVGIRGRAEGVVEVRVTAAGRQAVAHLKLTESGPCANPRIRAKLLCPDLKVAKPRDLRMDYSTRPGKALLRSTNDIQSRGQGPIEVRGRRDRPASMAVMQAIRRRSGGYSIYPSQMRLRFHNVGATYGGSYWKAANPLRFELWRIDRDRRRVKLERVGPKQFYCLRDLERTRPGPLSPSSAFYPACNQNPRTRMVTLGTSVGWSDIYPATYDEQWINVTGLRGCFAFLLRVDPLGQLYELNERNNVSQTIVRLPYRGSGKRGC